MPRVEGILWEGTSPVDVAPIVAIATDRTRNRKTGTMVQVWILRTDLDPVTAIREGQDRSICGSCPMRGDGMSGRACYVLVANAPLAVYKRYRSGGYRRVRPEDFEQRSVRWGAYGDPAMIPASVIDAVNAHASHWTGYTHQWRQPWASGHRGRVMASVETQRGQDTARAAGWGTFRAGLPDGSDRGRTTLCASERDGTTCHDCGKCDGAKRSIYIPAHGFGAGMVPASRLLRRAAA